MQSQTEKKLGELLNAYPVELHHLVEQLRIIIKQTLKDITEQVDMPARMIAFSYGSKYAEMICSIFPSKKGLKLSFYAGTELPNNDGLLQGNAKTTRYVVIDPARPLKKTPIIKLLKQAHQLYLVRMRGLDRN